jgi:hypothetical protein
MYSGALSGTEKMLATDELDQPYSRKKANVGGARQGQQGSSK